MTRVGTDGTHKSMNRGTNQEGPSLTPVPAGTFGNVGGGGKLVSMLQIFVEIALESADSRLS